MGGTPSRRPSRILGNIKEPPAPPPLPRDLTVPPPPLRADGDSSPVKSSPNQKVSRAPNALLVRAMAGRVADTDRILKMAQQIRSPGYGLRDFFEDCIQS